MIKIACCQYQIERLHSWENYVVKIEKIVSAAKNQDAMLLLMPEYIGTEIACKKFATDQELYNAIQLIIPQFIEMYKILAKKYQLYIQAGTIVEKLSSGKFANRAYLFSPSGSYAYQDKLQFTAYEKNTQLFQGGDHQKIFTTSFGKIGIAICYDSEFPETVRNLAQQGASLILVPSYTTTLAGYNRVFLSCRARAIENQCYVATAYVINENSLTDEIDQAYGQAAIFSPADTGFPDDGIIAQGKMNEIMLIIANIDFTALEKVRKEGQVHNFYDAQHYNKTEYDQLFTTNL